MAIKTIMCMCNEIMYCACLFVVRSVIEETKKK